MTDIEGPQAAPSATGETAGTQPLDSLVASIRAAIVPDATPETRAIAATACRALLTALETNAGEPLTTAQPTPASPASPTSPIVGLLARLASMPRDQMFDLLKQVATSPGSPVGGILKQLAGMPREQLVELVNKQLRALAPAGAAIQPPAGPRFHLIPIPQASRPGGGR
jgi:hypothetical protein